MMDGRAAGSRLFPYTTLFRSPDDLVGLVAVVLLFGGGTLFLLAISPVGKIARRNRDRKSTRLNSSHGYISYAVFCLKKKKAVTFKTAVAPLLALATGAAPA